MIVYSGATTVQSLESGGSQQLCAMGQPQHSHLRWGEPIVRAASKIQKSGVQKF